MSLEPGSRLGAYEIVALIGAGGMGEVYRARDTRLKREVAIKVLPDAFVTDPDRLARFQREAELLATLNHPNIAQIHGVEEGALILELVDGPTLADRVAHGPMPLDEALSIARQIAEALEAAHDRGIIHRDLKPANVKITNDGKVKVLDFGLAKASQASDSGLRASNLSLSPTITSPAMYTHAGIILGTAAYMSPEQARGKPLDRKTDIWSFGCVLFEMLSGTPVFGETDTASDAIAAVLKGEPNWAAIPAETPPAVRKLLERCLQRDTQKRLPHIGIARLELEEGPARSAVPQPGPARRSAMMAAAIMGAAVLGAGIVFLAMRGNQPQRLMRTSLAISASAPLAPSIAAIAISPNGRRIVFRGGSPSSGRLYLRDLDQFKAVVLRGTEGASSPFFAPDGEWIAFFAEGKLKKVRFDGSTPVDICLASGLGHGGAWAANDFIIFASSGQSSLFRVSANGGRAEPFTTVKGDSRDRLHRWPTLMPDDKSLLFVDAEVAQFTQSRIVAKSLETGEERTIASGGTRPRMLSTGHLIVARNGTLVAMPIESRWPYATGAAIELGEGTIHAQANGVAQFDISRDGTLVYVPVDDEQPMQTLAWVDRRGSATDVPELRKVIVSNIALSPDETRVALTLDERGRNIWVFDLVRGALTRLTFNITTAANPIWTPDGDKLAYSVNNRQISMKRADGSGDEEVLIKGDAPGNFPHSWSPDGRTLLFQRGVGQGFNDLWTLPLDGDRRAVQLFNTPFDETSGSFSPDGRWILYQSNESGRPEIYVKRYGASGERTQLSANGGTQPRWSYDGREVFYQADEHIMAVSVEGTERLTVSPPRRLFPWPYEARFTVSRSGRFLMVRGDQDQGVTQLNLVVGWSEVLTQRVPAK